MLSKKCLKVRLALGTSKLFKLSSLILGDMLNNFCFHVYAQKSLFIVENGNEYFWTAAGPPSPELRVHRAGSQLKMQ